LLTGLMLVVFIEPPFKFLAVIREYRGARWPLLLVALSLVGFGAVWIVPPTRGFSASRSSQTQWWCWRFWLSPPSGAFCWHWPGSTTGWAVILIVFTLFQVRQSRRWVHYDGD